MKKIFLALFVCLFPFVVQAQSVDPMKLPPITQYVNDFSNTLDSATLSGLNAEAKNYETKTTNQMVVVLFPNRNGRELADIGLKIFRDNKIGQAKKNNGVLLLIATGEKKIRIVTGYGLEGDIPDVLASDIIEKNVRPAVNDGKMADAIRGFFTRVQGTIGTDEAKRVQAAADQEGIMWLTAIAIVFGLLFAFNIYMLGFASVFFVIASFAVGSYYPLITFAVGALITVGSGFAFWNAKFQKTFFQVPQNGNGWGSNDSWGGGGSSGGGGGWFSGGGGSSGGGGAGD